MGIKKLVSAFVVAVSAASLFSIAPAQAETKSLVIIDSYFDSRVGSDVDIECLSGSLCGQIAKPNSSLTSETNHGVGMVDAAKSKFPSVPIIALQAASANSAMNVGNLIVALRWAVDNRDRIAAISVSRKMNGTKHSINGCDPASTNTASFGGVAKADATVRELISLLASYNIPVFVSTGNTKSNVLVDYPACINETNSVSVGTLNKLGVLVSNNSYNNSTDYFVTLADSKMNLPGRIFTSIPNTTSTATVLAAAKYVVDSSLTKFVVVN
jgi:hypothetical protein